MSYVKINNVLLLPLWSSLAKSGIVEELPAKAMAYQYIERNKKEALIKRNSFSATLMKKGLLRTVISYCGISEMFRTVVLSNAKRKLLNIIKI